MRWVKSASDFQADGDLEEDHVGYRMDSATVSHMRKEKDPVSLVSSISSITTWTGMSFLQYNSETHAALK